MLFSRAEKMNGIRVIHVHKSLAKSTLRFWNVPTGVELRRGMWLCISNLNFPPHQNDHARTPRPYCETHLIMSATTVTCEVAMDSEPADLERGPPTPDPTKDETQINESPLEHTFFSHTNDELLKQAREMSSSGKFIFCCFSELNTLLLLQQQDQILKLQLKLEDSVTGPGQWTDDDMHTLQHKMRQYRKVRYVRGG